MDRKTEYYTSGGWYIGRKTKAEIDSMINNLTKLYAKTYDNRQEALDQANDMVGRAIVRKAQVVGCSTNGKYYILYQSM